MGKYSFVPWLCTTNINTYGDYAPNSVILDCIINPATARGGVGGRSLAGTMLGSTNNNCILYRGRLSNSPDISKSYLLGGGTFPGVGMQKDVKKTAGCGGRITTCTCQGSDPLVEMHRVTVGEPSAPYILLWLVGLCRVDTACYSLLHQRYSNRMMRRA